MIVAVGRCVRTHQWRPGQGIGALIASGSRMESMSDIFFTCSECGEYLVVDDKGAGLAVDCPDYIGAHK